VLALCIMMYILLVIKLVNCKHDIAGIKLDDFCIARENPNLLSFFMRILKGSHVGRRGSYLVP
jgi:hypothetical protein